MGRRGVGRGAWGVVVVVAVSAREEWWWGDGRRLGSSSSKKKAPTERSWYANASYDWVEALARMESTLNASIGRYDSEKGEAAIGEALKDRSHAVWIVGGKIFVDKSFLGSMKNELHLRLVHQALGRAQHHSKQFFSSSSSPEKKKTRNQPTKGSVLLYGYESSASGTSKCDRALPTLVIAKKFHEQCGVMIPNPYFDILGEWKSDYERLLRLADRKPWESRNPRVFWRGSVRAHNSKDCDRDAGNYARLAASSLTLEYHKEFDVRPTDCEPRKSGYCDSVFKITPTEKRAASRRCAAVRGKFLPHGRFADYRFVLDLPGSTSGSYSRNLNHLWLLGAVVMTWTGPRLDQDGASQWYTPALRDGHTHLVVSRDTAPDLARAVVADPHRRDYLLANARAVAERLLCPDCLVAFLLSVLQALRHHFAYFQLLNGVDPATVARRRDLLKLGKCSSLKLVQVVGDRRSGRGSAPSWSVAVRPLHGISPCDLLDAASYKGTKSSSSSSSSGSTNGRTITASSSSSSGDSFFSSNANADEHATVATSSSPEEEVVATTRRTRRR